MLIRDQGTIEKYYQALLERNQSYVGIFFVGVKTTFIFCISSCRARKPKKENVEFYSTFKDALDNGYRPCKICKPTENANQSPETVKKAILLIKQNPKKKITDYELRREKISPEVVRRWFKSNYGMTYQAFQRMYRINNAYQELRQGKNATRTAFDAGYESLSGFNYTFKKLMGKSPKHGTDDNIILIDRLTTPIGPMFVAATEHGICLLDFVDRKSLETALKDLQQRLNAKIISGENDHIRQLKKELKAYFEGTRRTFDIKTETPGTDFQNQVWESLKDIEYGTTTSYQNQAERIKNPKAVRAVASANGHNRISIVIPCHRVIGKNGEMTGYGGGIERKKWLIAHERSNTH